MSQSSYLYDIEDDGSIIFRIEDASEKHLFGFSIGRADAETLLLTLAESISCARIKRQSSVLSCGGCR
jgi:hypothetical protein